MAGQTEDKRADNKHPSTRGMLLIGALVVAGLCVPWLLQDPHYRQLEGVPLDIRQVKGLEVTPIRKLVTRESELDTASTRYIVQYTFDIENTGDRSRREIRLHLRGVDADGRQLCSALYKPRVLDIARGQTDQAFVRAWNIKESEVLRLHRMILAVKSSPSVRPPLNELRRTD